MIRIYSMIRIYYFISIQYYKSAIAIESEQSSIKLHVSAFHESIFETVLFSSRVSRSCRKENSFSR